MSYRWEKNEMLNKANMPWCQRNTFFRDFNHSDPLNENHLITITIPTSMNALKHRAK